MTPETSTRLAAASPRPENASSAGSRGAPAAVFALVQVYFAPTPPDGGPPSFLDSNPSDPMTPDLHTSNANRRRCGAYPEHAAHP